MRDDRPCHDCVGRLTPWPAVRHRCYRDSTVASAAVAAMQVLHRTLGTWCRKVDAYFTLTNFARQQFVDAGFPADRIHVKHNCVHPDPGVGDGAGRYAMFAGRLSREKGVATLLAAWQTNPSLPPLKIAGDGPLAPDVQSAAARDARIDWLGRLPEPDVHRLMGAASVVLLPSVWYETFGRTIAEAYAGGTPVIASNLGAMAELVRDDQTGWLVRAGDAPALAAKVRAVLSLPAGVLVEFRRRARVEYEARFTPAANYSRLVEIYAAALAAAKTRSEPARQSGKLCDATPRRATTERSSLSPALKISTSE